jgi:hypothetical protein
MTSERQRQVLIGLLAVLALVIVWRVTGSSSGGGSGGAAVSGGGTSVADLAGLEVVPVHLSALELEEAEFHVGRDPFRFAAPPRQAAPQPSRPPSPPPRATDARPAEKPANRTPTTPQPPPVDVVYLGRFGTTSRPIAVFSDGNEIYNVLEGGVIKGQFVVDSIGYESADLAFVGFPDAPSKRLAVGG